MGCMSTRCDGSIGVCRQPPEETSKLQSSDSQEEQWRYNYAVQVFREGEGHSASPTLKMLPPWLGLNQQLDSTVNITLAPLYFYKSPFATKNVPASVTITFCTYQCAMCCAICFDLSALLSQRFLCQLTHSWCLRETSAGVELWRAASGKWRCVSGHVTGHMISTCLIVPQTLQSHYCPEVSSLATQLLTSVNKKPEENLGKHLDRDEEEVKYMLFIITFSFIIMFLPYLDNDECSN